jgi:hypothetical protein
MKINHHNYEEYFILYMDNELGADDRQMVEAFLQQHPDLKEELDLLLQYKFEPDSAVVFEGKEELLKVNGETPVSLSNYEEWMVLYNDNELTPAQRTMVEAFMISHPSLQSEFGQFKRARLTPETIVFAHKSSLYRKEERTKPLPWWRIAAAAILLLAISITAVVSINKKDPEQNDGLVKENQAAPVIQTKEQDPITTPVLANKEGDNEQAKFTTPVTAPVSNKNIAANQKTTIKRDKVQDVILPGMQEEGTVTAVKRNNELRTSMATRNSIDNNPANDAITRHITPETISQYGALTKPDVTTDEPGSSSITEDQSDDKKNKSRGLFRKIARTFEKRAGFDPTEDDRLLVAGLAIKLK